MEIKLTLIQKRTSKNNLIRRKGEVPLNGTNLQPHILRRSVKNIDEGATSAKIRDRRIYNRNKQIILRVARKRDARTADIEARAEVGGIISLMTKTI